MKTQDDKNNSTTTKASPARSKSLFRRIIKQLSSLRLAVIVMCLIAVVAAIGTFVEASLGLEHAQKLVYKSVWMSGIMIVFITNLTAVIIDRWPWQAKHSAFIFAHIGIIFIVIGQWLGNNYGLDGTMPISIGGENNTVTIADTEVQIYSSFDAQNYTRLYRQDVDFIKKPPRSDKPLVFKLENEEFRFVDFKPFVVPKREIVASEHALDGRAVRFQIKNPQTQMVEWLYQRNHRTAAQMDLGPLVVVLGPMQPEHVGRNQLHLEIQKDQLVVTTYRKESPEPYKRWIVKEGDSLELGWMGFELKVLRLLPQAKETWDFTEKSGPTPLTVPAAKIQYKDQEHWVLQNDTLKLFSDNAVYIVAYSQKRIDVGFPVKLLSFEKQNYQGISKAMAYQSLVTVPGVDKHLISMNEPLKYKGLTFYQASFQEDEMGRPIASVLSVNYDPGRFLKYFGSLIMSIGIILLFYFRKKWKWPSLKKP